MFHFIYREARLLGDRLERHRAIIRTPFEHRLYQRHETDLLSKKRIVLFQDRL